MESLTEVIAFLEDVQKHEYLNMCGMQLECVEAVEFCKQLNKVLVASTPQEEKRTERFFFGKMTWTITGLQPVTYNCWAEIIRTPAGETRMTIKYKEFGVWRSYVGKGTDIIFLHAETGHAGNATLTQISDEVFDGTWVDGDREGSWTIKFIAHGPQYKLSDLR
jgi:hypothetical protein